ncbi:MAG: hypothetical protein HFE86_04340 [Clostridiales bacterium]|nr:hypothetical protein [Clostridiales bacterium]
MNLIPCARPCSHQQEGYCGLETTSAVTNTAGGCPYFVKKQVGAATKEALRLPASPVYARGDSPPYAPDAAGLVSGITDPLSDADMLAVQMEPIQKRGKK